MSSDRTALKLSKSQLDVLATLLGIVIGVCPILAVNDIGNPKYLAAAAGIAAILQGYVTQKPADAHPTTAELEQSKVEGES